MSYASLLHSKIFLCELLLNSFVFCCVYLQYGDKADLSQRVIFRYRRAWNLPMSCRKWISKKWESSK